MRPSLIEVWHGLVGSSELGEYWAAAALAGAGSFVGECLDLSEGEPYSCQGWELLARLVCCTQLYQDFPHLFFSNRFWDGCPARAELSDGDIGDITAYVRATQREAGIY